MTTPSSTSLTIRRAGEADVVEIVDLAQAAYRGEGGWTTEAHLVSGSRTHADEVRGMLADPAVTLLVAELEATEREPESPGAEEADAGTSGAAESAGTSGTSLVGCCYTRQDPADDAGTIRAELGLFAVHPSAQSRGLGGRLLESQADLLGQAGVDVLMIQVLQSRTELHAWYERHGFLRTGAAVPFPGDPEWLQVQGLGMDLMERPLRTS
ncbi:GNAT family N-acetyltransferase [Brachybacterium sp. FME24]|uniref:GNAT family N-acetyltransferase n=1 Tax=Brachybacterium sp. FME24 TaxID=2742605 RepID=UPI001868C6A0|nr:GNAT family N-acetyltransferase [Brachybacterium sp. FME24]